jgi:biotin carboxyl carrier protein
MRMRITVEGVAYEVEVEMLDQAPTPPPGPGAAPAPTPASGPPLGSAPTPARPNRPTRPVTSDGAVHSPVAGTVQSVRVKPGEKVAVNDTLLVLEAMKMESEVASPSAGEVAEVLVNPGDRVSEGQVLVRLA